MASLKEIKNRIDSVKSTQILTSAMKMVSASKLRKSQQRLYHLRIFSSKLGNLFTNIYSGFEDETIKSIFVDKPQIKSVVIVVITSDKGLCGSFNQTIIKAALNMIETTYKSFLNDNKLEILCIGNKGWEFFAKKGYKIHSLSRKFYDPLQFEQTQEISQFLFKSYKQNIYDRVEIIYQRPINAAAQNLHIQRYFPLTRPADLNEIQNNKPLANDIPLDTIFLPNKKNVIVNILPYLLQIYFYYVIIESSTAEHGARMTAMHKASENAAHLHKSFNLAYNKKRQSSITNELLEIVNGSIALQNQ